MALWISSCYLLCPDAVPVCLVGSCVPRYRSWVWHLLSLGHRSCLMSLADISVHLPCPACSACQSSCSTLWYRNIFCRILTIRYDLDCLMSPRRDCLAVRLWFSVLSCCSGLVVDSLSLWLCVNGCCYGCVVPDLLALLVLAQIVLLCVLVGNLILLVFVLCSPCHHPSFGLANQMSASDFAPLVSFVFQVCDLSLSLPLAQLAPNIRTPSLVPYRELCFLVVFWSLHHFNSAFNSIDVCFGLLATCLSWTWIDVMLS